MRRSSEGGVPSELQALQEGVVMQPDSLEQSTGSSQQDAAASPASTGPRPLKVLEVILTTVQIKGP